MKLLLTAATQAEISPVASYLSANWKQVSAHIFEKQGCRVTVLVTGAGMVPTTCSLSLELCRERYDLAIQAGIAGSFDRTLNLGDVVFITSDLFADMGAEDHDNYLDMFELGLMQPDTPPFADGRLPCLTGDVHENIGLPQVSSLTVNTVSGNARTIALLTRRYGCQLESMEGAAFHYTCLRQGQAFAQVRAISNYVTPRDRSSWHVGTAVTALNDWLITYLEGMFAGKNRL